MHGDENTHTQTQIIVIINVKCKQIICTRRSSFDMLLKLIDTNFELKYI